MCHCAAAGSGAAGHTLRALTPVSFLPLSIFAADEHDKYAFEDHGHRFEFLLKPLPPTEEEEVKR